MDLSAFLDSLQWLLETLTGFEQGSGPFWVVLGAGAFMFLVIAWVLSRTACNNDAGGGTTFIIFALQLLAGFAAAAAAGPLCAAYVDNPDWDLPLSVTAGILAALVLGLLMNRFIMGMKLASTVFVLAMALGFAAMAVGGARMSIQLFDAGRMTVESQQNRDLPGKSN
jgi:hypothetical protein